MPSNIDKFEADLDAAYDEAVVQKFVQFHRTITLKALRYTTADSRSVGFAYGSPVWSGRFRASFNLSIGQPDYSVKAPHPEVASGELRWPDEPSSPLRTDGVAAGAAQLLNLQPFDITYIANGLPYARRLENGYSLKAPEGVLGIVAEKLGREFDGVVIK